MVQEGESNPRVSMLITWYFLLTQLLTCISCTKPTAPVINIAAIFTSFLTIEITVKKSAVKLISASGLVIPSIENSQTNTQRYYFSEKHHNKLGTVVKFRHYESIGRLSL